MFVFQDGAHTCHGEEFAAAAAKVSQSPQVVAVGMNCTNPRYITVEWVTWICSLISS